MDQFAETGKDAEFTQQTSSAPAEGRARAQIWRTRALDRFAAGDLAALVAGISARAIGAGIPDFKETALLGYSRATAPELASALGIPLRAALRIACAFELGRRAAASTGFSRAPVRTPRDAFELVHDLLHGRDRETVVALYLDGRHRLLQRHEVSIGTATASLIHPREVFGPALRSGACAVVIAHNHPSGDPEPSAEDHGVTERLLAAGELVGVPLLDHIVVGGSAFVSLRGRGSWASVAHRQPGS